MEAGMDARTLAPSLALAALVLACGGSPIVMPPGLAPLEEVTAPEPAPVGGDARPEAVSVVSGDGSDWDYAHARGYVHAPIAKVWEAMQAPGTVVDRRRVAEYTITPGVEAGYDVSFLVHNVVRDIVTVEFDTTWRQGVVQGTREAPEMVAGRAAKTAGTAYIDLLEDSIVLTRVDDEVTRVDHVRHIKSATAGAEEAHLYLEDCFASLVAVSHGRPLPAWR